MGMTRTFKPGDRVSIKPERSRGTVKELRRLVRTDTLAVILLDKPDAFGNTEIATYIESLIPLVKVSKLTVESVRDAWLAQKEFEDMQALPKKRKARKWNMYFYKDGKLSEFSSRYIDGIYHEGTPLLVMEDLLK